MNKARYYIYRNLHTGGFSIRYKGKVVNRLNIFTAIGVVFKVNESGRSRVLQEGRKNVHAFVVADKYKGTVGIEVDKLPEISYNPYLSDQFKCNGVDINKAELVVFKNKKCYLQK